MSKEKGRQKICRPFQKELEDRMKKDALALQVIDGFY